MKRIKFNMAWLLILALFAATSCKDDETTPLVTAEDGMYVFGAGTALTTYDIKGLMKSTPNEVGGVDRPGLSELYIAVKAGTDGFNLTAVVGGKAKTYGPSATFAEVTTKDAEEPNAWFARGAIEETASKKFTVPENGLYHIVYDATLNTVVVARVNWGIIGSATANGWGGSTALTSSAFDLNSMSFEKTDVILIAGAYKFRYSNGWKIFLDATGTVKVNTNYGGALTALVSGAGDIANTVVGKYTVKVTWTLAAGTAATLTKTGDYTPPAYPTALSVIGAGTAYGWNAMSTNSEMHKCAGGAPTEGIFWKILYLTAGEGFKIAGTGWTPSYSFTDITSFDATGIAVTDLGAPDHNWSVATSGMYIVVLNLRDNLKKVSIKVPEVYGIGKYADGNAFGDNFDKAVAANKFTVNNTAKTLVSPVTTHAGNLRSYVSHAWIPDWWQAEFIVSAGAIVYRNDGGDPAAAPLTIGQKVTYHFDDNTGSIGTK